MAATAFQRLPGFRDFPPEEFHLRRHVFEAWRRVSRRYGFQEYDGPRLEPLDLYVEKSGEEIVGQLYAFEDKGGRDVTLRPEMTPSLARILGERSRGMSKPIRWFTIPQLFRYERQQRGRLREHFQWNVDIVGEADVAADAEVLAVAIDALRELALGADDFHARVSDRRLLAAVLDACGVVGERLPAAFAVIDKLGRDSEQRTLDRLGAEVGLDATAARRVLDVFGASELDGVRAAYGDHESVGAELERLDRYLARLHAMGLGAFVEFDLRIVRGLAYYTGIVFELFDRRGELRAICGGGRYDRLLELVGGEPLPAVGFGMGDVVLGELLSDRGLIPDASHRVDFALVVIGEEQQDTALAVAHALRDRGRSVTYALRDASVRKQFGAAANQGAREVLVFGPDEVARGVVQRRDMATGSESEVAIEDLVGGVDG